MNEAYQQEQAAMDEDIDKEGIPAETLQINLPEAPILSTAQLVDKRLPHDALTVALPPCSPLASSPRRFSPRRPNTSLRSPSQQSVASTNSNAPTISLNKRTSMSSLRSAKTPPRSPITNGRKSSAGLLPGSTIKPSSPREPARPIQTASSVAKEYFTMDIKAHAELEPSQTPDVAVIFHDDCYGHRFSRPRTSKANLSMIVERPERILATVLGVSAAYVLLGGRHANGSSAPYPTALPAPPPFLIRKSSRNADITSLAVTNVHGARWMTELKEMCENAESKLTQNGKELVRPKDPSNAEKPRLHEGDLYLCAESLAAFEGALGGVLDAVDAVFSPSGPRRVFACVRPPGHHCSDDYPSGFCWLNNVHVGISHAAIEHGLTHAAIFDFDLHHGDGSQSITWAHNARAATLPKNAHISKKTAIGYYSLHDINSYPCEYGDEDKVRNASLCIDNAHGQSIWNVHLQPWKTDDEFWKLYDERYLVLIDKMRGFLKLQNDRYRSMGAHIRPKGAIFISAGFDASEWEGHGMQRHKVNVPTDFYARISRDIAKLSVEEGLGVDGRIISVLEGGYSDRALVSGVLSHVCGLASTPKDMSAATAPVTSSIAPYEAAWWSPTRLEELEACAGSTARAPQAKQSKSGNSPSYHSPTQSFVAKVVSQPTYQRSVANSLSRQSSASMERARTPTPPPPEVGWAIASYELSQLIIPLDRQTRSCQPEDLNAKATEVRKSRQSAIGITPLPIGDDLQKGMEKMNLRDRRMKAPAAPNEETRAESRADRRKTFGGIQLPSKEPVRQSSRRLSVASATTSTVADELPIKSAAMPQTEVPPVPNPRATSKTRAPRKTATKPSVPKNPVIVRKGSIPPTIGDGTSRPAANADGSMDDLVSGMQRIWIKPKPPSRTKHDRDIAAANEVKKPIRAPRRPAVKKTTNKDSESKLVASAPALARPVEKAAAPKIETAMPEAQPGFAMSADGHTSTVTTTSIDPASTTIAPQVYQRSVDSMMLNHAPFESALADYLAPVTIEKPAGVSSQHMNEFQQYQTPMINHSTLPGHDSNLSSAHVWHNQLPTFTATSPIRFASMKPDVNQSPIEQPLEEDNGFGPDHGFDPNALVQYPMVKDESQDN